MSKTKTKYSCSCGHILNNNSTPLEEIRCPACGRIITIPSREINSSNREEFERFVDATFELLGEISNDVCPFSGAR